MHACRSSSAEVHSRDQIAIALTQQRWADIPAATAAGGRGGGGGALFTPLQLKLGAAMVAGLSLLTYDAV